ncbi:hypothetical protein BsWGS_21783 [Bradybaena similaris]
MLAHRPFVAPPGKRKLQEPTEEISALKRLQQFRYQKRPALTHSTARQKDQAGETDLRGRDCSKNPGHRSFVAIGHFNVNHLPPAYHDEDLVECVRALSNLTAQVTVQHESESKNHLCPGSRSPVDTTVGKPKDKTMATGLVYKIHKYSSGRVKKDTSCPCKECKDSPTPKSQFAHIVVQTTSQIASDCLDNAQITSHLFFDKGQRPDAYEGVITLKNVLGVETLGESERCELTYLSHDMYMAERLEKCIIAWQNLRGRLITKYLTSRYSQAMPAPLSGYIPDNEQPLVIIVSHPHGCSKQVSIGHCVQRDDLGNGLTRYSYSAATCPGSSGARLMIVGKAWWWWHSDHIHGGMNDVSWEISCSGPGSDRLP